MKYSYCIPALIVLALTLSGCGKDSGKHAENLADEVMPVDVARPTTDSLTIRRTFPAYLSADKKVEVVARVNGYVTSKNYEDGQYVKRGQVLFTIEDTQYRDAVAQAESALSSAKSQADYASRQYEAMKKALESDAVSKMDVVQAENAMNAGNSSIKNAEAALQTARTNLGYCTVRALTDGHVQAANVNVGDYVSGAGEPVTLTTIYDDSSLNAIISITDDTYMQMLDNFGSDLANYKNIPVEFSQGLPHSYSGDMNYISPEINQSTGTMIVRIKVENPYGELKDGMYAQVHLPVMTARDALLIRDSAISTDQRGKYIYVVNDSNRVVYTPIEIGETYHDTLRIVTSGISPVDRYVTKALLKVRNGMPVKPVEQ